MKITLSYDYPPNLPNISERFIALVRDKRFSSSENEGYDPRAGVIRILSNGLGFEFEFHNGKFWQTIADKTLRGLIVKAEKFLKEGAQ